MRRYLSSVFNLSTELAGFDTGVNCAAVSTGTLSL